MFFVWSLLYVSSRSEDGLNPKDWNPVITEGRWQSVPYRQTQNFYLLKSTAQIAAGITVRIRAIAKTGKLTVFAGTHSNVRDNYKSKMDIDAARTYADDFKIKITVTSIIYIGIEPSVPDAACKVKYTFEECVPSRIDIREGDWYTVPSHGQRCFYILETFNQVPKGTAITINAKATKDKAKIFVGM